LSLTSLLTSVESSLSKAGISSARAEAEIIAGHVLGLKRTGLYLEGARDVSQPDRKRVLELARLRAARYPLQYITGECEFMSLAFEVREGVFIPRPETEVLVECVIDKVRAKGAAPRAILEIGTGSGVICVCLGRSLGRQSAGRLDIVATDVSPVAVETARANALGHGVRNLMQFVLGDGISFLRESGGGGRFDIFVCNPPYVAASQIEGLEPEVRDHEPRAALDGGEDGLEFMRRIIPALPSILSRGALAAFEIAPDQGAGVGRLLTGAGAGEVGVVKDLSGRDRVITARMA
jgi:release factor glutamine methyltransferase